MSCKNELKYYRDGILETLQDINRDRYYKSKISKRSIDNLINLVEAYSIVANGSRDSETINESISLSKQV